MQDKRKKDCVSFNHPQLLETQLPNEKKVSLWNNHFGTHEGTAFKLLKPKRRRECIGQEPSSNIKDESFLWLWWNFNLFASLPLYIRHFLKQRNARFQQRKLSNYHVRGSVTRPCLISMKSGQINNSLVFPKLPSNPSFQWLPRNIAEKRRKGE